MEKFLTKQYNICVIGLGYVGLPLAYELAKDFKVTGFDLNTDKLYEYENGNDVTNEVGNERLRTSTLVYTSDLNDISDCNVFIVCVPTPINSDKTPDLTPIVSVTKMLRDTIREKALVIYESTVYPGTTEEVCLPILLENSKFKYNENISLAYSPERINPGDKVNTIRKIKKVISASNNYALENVYEIYNTIIDAGIFKAESIKVAEAAKVIENAQRDVNIAFMNEISQVFNRMDIRTGDVLDAASTKWNFIKFTPGLVGGHCIGVDPYYFLYKAEELGYYSELLSSARRINDGMANHIVYSMIKKMISSNFDFENEKLLVYGLTFKENCNDIRNSKVLDILDELNKIGIKFDIYDPYLLDQEDFGGYQIKKKIDLSNYKSMLISVAHEEVSTLIEENKKTLENDKFLLFDLKGTTKKILNQDIWSL